MKEFDLIRKLACKNILHEGKLIQGIGDDSAVLDFGGERYLLVTTDGLYEDVHFKTKWTDFKTLGRKALNINLSDIAAMGGWPLYYFVTVGVPKGAGDDNVMAFFDGMAEAAAPFSMKLIGGDTSASAKGWQISVTVIGEVERDRLCLRSRAKEGDGIFVTGALGGSALGLNALIKGKSYDAWRPYIERHNAPAPRVELGRWLAGLGCVSAMIDISDGLVLDLGHIAEASGVGFLVEVHKVPVVEGFSSAYKALKLEPWPLVLAGGEEYELLFTVSRDKVGDFEKISRECLNNFQIPITMIGEVTAKDKGCRVVNVKGEAVEIKSQGYEHEF